MPEPLVITIAHKMGKEEALRRVKPALAKASESFPVLKVEEEVWSGDRLDFRMCALGPGRGRQYSGRRRESAPRSDPAVLPRYAVSMPSRTRPQRMVVRCSIGRRIRRSMISQVMPMASMPTTMRADWKYCCALKMA